MLNLNPPYIKEPFSRNRWTFAFGYMTILIAVQDASNLRSQSEDMISEIDFKKDTTGVIL